MTASATVANGVFMSGNQNSIGVPVLLHQESFYIMEVTEKYQNSSYDLISIFFNGSPQGTTDIEKFLNFCSKLYSRPRKMVLYIDTTNLSQFSLQNVYLIAKYIKAHSEETKQRILEIGIYVPNKIISSAIELLKTIRTPSVPWHIITTENERELYNIAMTQRLF